VTRKRKCESSESKVDPADVLSFFELLFSGDEKLKIIDLLARREAASTMEIGRCTSLSYGKTTRCLNSLVKRGVLNSYLIGSGLLAYRFSPDHEHFKMFYQQNLQF
jgi:predicted transcriptional regulator